MSTPKIYYSDRDVRRYVHNIIRAMQQDNWCPDYVVGLTRGGLVPANMISQYLDVRMECLKVSLRDSDSDSESNLWMAEDAYGHEIYDPMSGSDGRKKILIVDDINDTGATLNWIKKDWQSGCFPDDTQRWDHVWKDNVRFAVLADNQASDFQDVNYSGTEINKAEEDCWIVFPWENWWE
jgi:xanthine phosphoribosyltransferase